MRSNTAFAAAVIASTIMSPFAASAVAGAETSGASMTYCGLKQDGSYAQTWAGGVGCRTAIAVADKASARIWTTPSGRVRVGKYVCAIRPSKTEGDGPTFRCRKPGALIVRKEL